MSLNTNISFSSLPPLEVMYKIRQQRPDLFDKMEGNKFRRDFDSSNSHNLRGLVYIDGGITRGSGM
jgi:hypothetical protein